MKRPKAWAKREYPWTPGRSEMPVQSFAAIRSGLLPVIEQGTYSILDVYTKPGMKRYEKNIRRAIIPAESHNSTPALPGAGGRKPTKRGK